MVQGLSVEHYPSYLDFLCTPHNMTFIFQVLFQTKRMYA